VARTPDRLPDFSLLPIGAYAVDPEGRVLGSNDAARRLLGLSEEPGAQFAAVLADPSHFEELTREALDREKEDGSPTPQMLHLRVAGQDVFVEHFFEPFRDSETNELLGFVACLSDVTDRESAVARDESLQNKVEELTFDIGRILHANTSTLIMVNQTLAAAASALRDDTGGDAEGEDIEEQVAKRAGALADAIEKLAAAGEPERRSQALPDEAWDTLAAQVRILRDYEQLVPVEEIRNATLRSSAAGILRLCGQLQAGWLPREPVRNVTRVARGLERLTCSRDVETTRTAVVQMDFTLRALRDFVTSEVRVSERPRRINVNALVQEAIAQLADFAQASNVEIGWRDRPRDLEIRGNERDLVRAVSNVLHNAIKYSWQRDRSKSPWIAIRTSEQQSLACIELESWGVPITAEELEEELVYTMGYRGKWSTDRGRLGTGIGLTDTQRVLESAGGSVVIESKPAQPTSLRPDDREYYQQPFLTKVSLRLPLAD
jgi:PAS domain S-box-containing protein